jgi:hypothetical protein
MLIKEADPLIRGIMPSNRILDLTRIKHLAIKGIVNLRPVNHSMGITIRLPNACLRDPE